MKVKTLMGVLLLIYNASFAQKTIAPDWNNHEVVQYETLSALAEYVAKTDKSKIYRDTLFKKYIYFDNVLGDADTVRREQRIVSFDELFPYFTKTLDSLGLLNLDAKPIRFYKSDKIYDPFREEGAKQSIDGESMYIPDTDVFAYFRKSEPNKPLGVLLFEHETNKLAAWILINQGGYKYFLTFNLLGGSKKEDIEKPFNREAYREFFKKWIRGDY